MQGMEFRAGGQVVSIGRAKRGPEMHGRHRVSALRRDGGIGCGWSDGFCRTRGEALWHWAVSGTRETVLSVSETHGVDVSSWGVTG